MMYFAYAADDGDDDDFAVAVMRLLVMMMLTMRLAAAANADDDVGLLTWLMLRMLLMLLAMMLIGVLAMIGLICSVLRTVRCLCSKRSQLTEKIEQKTVAVHGLTTWAGLRGSAAPRMVNLPAHNTSVLE